MQVVRDVGLIRDQSNVVAIGSFDGVHRGHQALIRMAVEKARTARGRVIVLTFDPHPLEVINPARAPLLLTTSEEKRAAIEALGAEYLLVLPFTREMAQKDCQSFAREILRDGIGARRVLVGFNFSFGYRGVGTPQTLGFLGRSLGFEVDVLPPVVIGGETVSSTLIREMLSTGKVGRAAELLGRSYAVTGLVISGHGRGRGLGLPTANLVWPAGKVVPARGVYVVRVEYEGFSYLGVANLGRQPTFGPDGPEDTLEVHLLDFSGDLYGRELTVQFVEWLREEQRFPGVKALLEQVGKDILRARTVLSRERRGGFPFTT
ncbi:MAG: bifunctional riboflavin kinase/FAD synthetase [Firmicutes bacterium]|nr:bifunctional riboflavin kinase/FAD synthetase [Bacillota bacterium]MCL5040148.1 bifunctional riboflavin kinase/FAD synthetase [Bacillota bacterium]